MSSSHPEESTKYPQKLEEVSAPPTGSRSNDRLHEANPQSFHPEQNPSSPIRPQTDKQTQPECTDTELSHQLRVWDTSCEHTPEWIAQKLNETRLPKNGSLPHLRANRQ